MLLFKVFFIWKFIKIICFFKKIIIYTIILKRFRNKINFLKKIKNIVGCKNKDNQTKLNYLVWTCLFLLVQFDLFKQKNILLGWIFFIQIKLHKQMINLTIYDTFQEIERLLSNHSRSHQVGYENYNWKRNV
jgi:hypothetical protein